jgi:hypothetical protein
MHAHPGIRSPGLYPIVSHFRPRRVFFRISCGPVSRRIARLNGKTKT